MPFTLYPAKTRGHLDYGWLKAYYSFSFGQYYDPQRIQFGALRVLNDDIMAPGTGFGTHPHDNMEIVTIPLQGGLAHKDSTGGQGVIWAGDIQVMSAGTGLTHSEFNASKTEEARTLQIWVFPKKPNIKPRYEQRKFEAADRQLKWQIIVTPDATPKATSGPIWINQDALFLRGDFPAGAKADYFLRFEDNGAYLFVIDGEVEVEGKRLGRRDAIGIWDEPNVPITVKADSQLLLIEVPMTA